MGVPEVLAGDGIQLLSHSAVDGSLRSFLRCLQEHAKECEQQGHYSRVADQL